MVRTIKEWSCDLCDHSLTTNEATDKPLGWSVVKVPDLESKHCSQEKTIHICGVCKEKVKNG